MKTLDIIECRTCRGSYFSGKKKVTLFPGTEDKLPDEVAFNIRKISACTGCKERMDRTRGGKRKRFER